MVFYWTVNLLPREILIQTIGKEWNPGIVISEREGLEKVLPKFSHFMAFVMKRELKRAIKNQRYIRNWPPLSVSYYEYKQRKNLSLNIWEATGFLADSISYWRSGDRWVVGIPRRVNYPGSALRVYKVAQWMEYGTDKMPARPLFRPLQIYLRKNIRPFWEAFLKEEGL